MHVRISSQRIKMDYRIRITSICAVLFSLCCCVCTTLRSDFGIDWFITFSTSYCQAIYVLTWVFYAIAKMFMQLLFLFRLETAFEQSSLGTGV